MGVIRMASHHQLRVAYVLRHRACSSRLHPTTNALAWDELVEPGAHFTS
jgi:hypothetical protein